MKEFPERVNAVRIWTYGSPLLILLGTIGNILAITVLSRRRSRTSSIAIFLCALGVSDIVLLNTGLLRYWITAISDFDIRTTGNAACKIHVFFVYLSCHCSSWFLVAVSCERFLSVWLPHKVKIYCTPKRSLIIVVVLLGLLMLLNSNLLLAVSIVKINIDNVTTVLLCDTNEKKYNENWHWIHLCVFCLIPFTLLLICNCSIILKLIKGKSHIRLSQTTVENLYFDKTRQMTTLLVMLNIVFFMNTLPMCIFLIINPDMYNNSDHEHAKQQFYYAIVNMFLYLNSAINFVLYFLSGSRFRDDIKALLCSTKCFDKTNLNSLNWSQTPQTTIWSQPERSVMDTSSEL